MKPPHLYQLVLYRQNWKWSKDISDFFIRFNTALTNSHILFHVLRYDDGTRYHSIPNRLNFFSIEQFSELTVS